MPKPTLSARAVSQRLARAGHSRTRRDHTMFAGRTSGYMVTGDGPVRVEAVATTLYRTVETEARMLDGYAATLEAAGYAVAREERALAVTLTTVPAPEDVTATLVADLVLAQVGPGRAEDYARRTRALTGGTR